MVISSSQWVTMEENKEMYEHFKKIKLFPGTKEEFEKVMGYMTEVIDTGEEDMGVCYCKNDHRCPMKSNYNVMKKVYEEGIVAIVNASFDRVRNTKGNLQKIIYGLPVKKLKEEIQNGN